MSENRKRQTVRNVVQLFVDEKKSLSPLEISQKLGVSCFSVLTGNPELFEQFNDGQLRFQLVATLFLCEEHCDHRKNCKSPDCMGLHLCRFYMTSGKCKYDQGNCSYGHDLATPHNQQILENKFLDGLPIETIRFLLNQTGSSHKTGSSRQTGSSHKGKTPMVCKFYNESKCRNTEKCPYLHLCRDYVESICRKGKECPKSHNVLHPDVKSILEKRGISTQRPAKEIVEALRDAVSGMGGSGTKTDKAVMKLSAKMKTMTLAKQETAATAKAGANQTSDSKKGGNRPNDKKGQDKLPSNEDWKVFPSDVNIDTEQKYSDPKNAGSVSGRKAKSE